MQNKVIIRLSHIYLYLKNVKILVFSHFTSNFHAAASIGQHIAIEIATLRCKTFFKTLSEI